MGVTIPGPSGEVLEQYEVSNSLRFNDDDSAYLEKDFSSDGSRQKFTWSAWIKRSTLGANQVPFGAAEATGRDEIRLNSSDQFQVFFGDASDANLITTRVFRDVSAWYHFVVAVDTTNGTANNRIRVYVNGVEETSFGTRSNPSENYQMDFTADCPHRLGVEGSGTTLDFDGYMTEVNFVDGQQYDPTYFGKFDDNNVWIPKRYTGTYGTNGFFLEFKQTGTSANSSGIGADTSGNDHHFTPNNLAATDVTEDTCTNNFATLNPLSDLNCTFSEGNVEVIRASDAAASCVSTIAPTSGKWYYEFQLSAGNNVAIGVAGLDDWQSGTDLNDYANKAAVMLIEASYNASIGYVASSSSATTLQNSTNLNTAKYGMAVDLDNGNMYASANGSWYSSVSGAFDKANFSDATAIVTDIPTGETMAMAFRIAQSDAYVNFGNPGSDDTISSGNTDGKYGNFEYAVPSGYYALCTKRLAEFG